MPAVWKFQIVAALASSSAESSWSFTSPRDMALRHETVSVAAASAMPSRVFRSVSDAPGDSRPAVDDGWRGDLLAELHPADPRLRDAERGSHVLAGHAGVLAQTAKRGA